MSEARENCPHPEQPHGRFGKDRTGGIIAIGLGLLALGEAARLYHLRSGTLVGDHVMPGAIGMLLVILGAVLAVHAEGNTPTGKLPRGRTLVRLCGSFTLLFVYWFLMDRLGYLASTFLVLIGLFKTMSQYGWLKSILYAAIVSVTFGYLFMNLLNIALPIGVIGIG